MRTTVSAIFCILGATSVSAGVAFGTDEEARSIAAQMNKIVQSGGVDAAIDAMHSPDQLFVTTQMGVHVFEQSIIVAENREPELIASSYAEVEDLTGEPMWPRILAAADAKSDAILEWYHYDTETEYTYNCYSEWATPGDVLVMVCR